MKTIYTAVIARLKEKVPALRWIDLDTGQLEAPPSVEKGLNRSAVAFPCALIGINITRSEDITDTDQECEARVVVRLAFDSQLRTSADAPPAAREKSLAPYDVIADTYAALQGWGTESFDTLSRVSQQKENSRDGRFIYRIDLRTTFEDITASQ